MALITCPECGRQISDKAPACIGCGIPMEEIRKMLHDTGSADTNTETSKQQGADYSSVQIPKVNSLSEKHVKCVICGCDFSLSDFCCPQCKYPALTISRNVPKPDLVRAYRKAIGFITEEEKAQQILKEKRSRSSKIIGIDFGATNSRVAVIEGGKPIVISNAEGSIATPSVVSFTRGGEILAGTAARKQAITNADRTIYSIRKHLGEDYKVDIDGKAYRPQDISAIIISKLKEDAEEYLGGTVDEAVITVPVYFTDVQKRALKEACDLAGLKAKRFVSGPAAAALAYGFSGSKDAQKVLVYDIGGGSLGVSVMELGDDVYEVLAYSGDNDLGGDDFDKALINYIADSFRQEHSIDLRYDRVALQRLKEAAEKAKNDLSSTRTAYINLPFISASIDGPLHLEMDITRDKFNYLTRDLVSKAVEPISKAMRDAGLDYSDLDKVIIVGGASRIPALQDSIQKVTGKELFKGINPDECAAIGAAIEGGILSGDLYGILLLDVTPFSLSIETFGGVSTRIIERNTTIPTKNSVVFSTAADNQVAVDIHVLQGEAQMAKDNIPLGKFQLSGIAPAPKGVPQIEVTFEIDTNGLVIVSARDLGTGQEKKVTLKA